MLVIFAVSVGAFIMLAGLALDIGNWFVHKRKLQSRVDAAAYAAAVEYGYRFPGCIGTTLADDIRDAALRFGGDGSATNPVNAQVNEGAVIKVNASTPEAPEYSDNGGSDATPCFDHAPDPFGTPTGGYWTDVKGLDQSAVSLLGFGGVIPTPKITASARVAVQQLDELTGHAPLAVADPGWLGTTASPSCVVARFDIEDNGTLDEEIPLADTDGDGVWTLTVPFSRQIPGDGLSIGIRMGENCATDASSVTFSRVATVSAFPGTGIGRADLDPLGDCSYANPSGNAYFVARKAPDPCRFSIRAVVRWPDSSGCTTGPNRTVSALVGTDAGGFSSYLLSPTGNPEVWVGDTGSSGVAPGDGADGSPPGAVDVRIEATQSGNGPGCDAQLGPETRARISAGDDRQVGPIRDLYLATQTINQNNVLTLNGSDLSLRLDALDRGTTIVRGVTTGSANELSGAIVCDAVPDYQSAVDNGCRNTVAVGATTTGLGAAGAGTLTTAYNAKWAPSGVCATNRLQGLANPTAVQLGNIPRGDPRLVLLATTRVSRAYDDGATQTVTGFTALYVTGWQGAPAGCSGENDHWDDYTWGGSNPNHLPPATFGGPGGLVWGKVIKFVTPPSQGVPVDSDQADEVNCNPADIVHACIATLVK